MKWKVTAVVLTVAAMLVAAVAPSARDLSPDPTAVASSSHESPRGLLPSYTHGKRIFSLRDVLAAGAIAFTLAPPAGRLVPIERNVEVATPHVATPSIAIRGPPHA